MSLVVAKIVGLNICVISDTKLSLAGHEEIRSKQHPKDGVIKTTILNKQQCVSFAGSEYYAEAALKEMEQGGTVDEMQEILFRYHSFSDYQTAFIFCFFEDGPHIVSFENGQMIKLKSAWIGDVEAYTYYQQYYHGDIKESHKRENENIESIAEGSRVEEIRNTPIGPNIKNIKLTINSKVPNEEFSKMAAALDNVIYNHSLPTVGGFRIQVTYDDGMFSYARYTSISNEEIDIIPGEPGRFAWTNASKGSYYVNCAKGFDNYTYTAIHVMEANLGILYIRDKNGLMRPKLCHLDVLDFSDFISQYKLAILISDHHRPPKYYRRAETLFKKEKYFEAIYWLCQAIRFSARNQTAQLYYFLGLSFHNYGRPLTAKLCFEHAIALDPAYEQVLANQKSSE
jgi:tetratricopeptide (TPR) repeat protein